MGSMAQMASRLSPKTPVRPLMAISALVVDQTLPEETPN